MLFISSERVIESVFFGFLESKAKISINKMINKKELEISEIIKMFMEGGIINRI